MFFNCGMMWRFYFSDAVPGGRSFPVLKKACSADCQDFLSISLKISEKDK
jgi:hypothetical protein